MDRLWKKLGCWSRWWNGESLYPFRKTVSEVGNDTFNSRAWSTRANGMLLEGLVQRFPLWDSGVGGPKIACVESPLSAKSGEKWLRISSRGQSERVKQQTTLVKYRLSLVHDILSDHFHQELNYIRSQLVEVTSRQGIRAHDLTQEPRSWPADEELNEKAEPLHSFVPIALRLISTEETWYSSTAFCVPMAFVNDVEENTQEKG